MVTFTINGVSRSFDGDPEMPLLWYLRDELGLTGTKFGCGGGFCGACTVHLNNKAVRSCQIPMSTIGGGTIVSIEGLSPDQSHPVQRAWVAANVAQCGYCQVGQIMQAAALLAEKPHPTDADIDSDHERQHLPVRHVSAHSSGHQARGGGTVMTPQDNPRHRHVERQPPPFSRRHVLGRRVRRRRPLRAAIHCWRRRRRFARRPTRRRSIPASIWASIPMAPYTS